jgi:O-antigen/teichoic acid export membrane protein
MYKRIKELYKNEGFYKYFKNTSWLLFERILRIVVSLFIGVWVTRYLGPSDFGLFSYVQSFVMLFAAIASLGLNSILVREFVNHDKNTESLITTSYILKVLGSCILLILLSVFTFFGSSESETNKYIYIVGFGVFFQSFNVIDSYFQSKVKSKYIVYANIFSLILSSIAKITLILIEAPLVYFVYIVLFDSITVACGYVYFAIKKGNFKFIKLKFNLKLAKLLLKDSWPLMLSGMVVSFYMRIDQIMIKQMLGNVPNGEYAAAVRLSESVYFIPMIIGSSLFPAIINAKKISNKLYYDRFQNLYDIMVWMAIFIALPLSFFSEEIISFFYKGAYSNSAGVLEIHVWTGVFVFLGVAYSKYLVSENFTLKSLYKTLLGAAVNVVVNYFLIPIYGIKGAAIATFVSQFTANYLYDIFDKDLHKQLIMKTKSFIPIHLLKK